MSRKTFVYDKYAKKLVERASIPRLAVHHVMPDIKEYQVVGPEYGKVITSRSKHRAYLKAHNLVEVGDQKPQWLKNKNH